MRMVLAVDPGETSGVALLRYSTIYNPLVTVLTSEVYDYNADALLTFFSFVRILAAERPLEMLLEAQPVAPSTPHVNGLIHVLTERANAHRIPVRQYRPADWKPVVRALDVQPPKNMRSRHAKDAWLMAYHHIRRTTK